MFFVVALLSLITLLFLWLKWNYGFWQKLGVPGPEPTYLLGNIATTLTMTKNLNQLTEEWYNSFPGAPYIGYYKFLSPAIMLRDVELIKDVLLKNASSFSQNDFVINKKNDPLLGKNPFVNTGEEWREARATFTQLFSIGKVKQMFPIMQLACNDLDKFLHKLKPIDDIEAKDFCANFTTQNIIRCAFSMDAKCFEDSKSEFRDMGKTVFQPSFWQGLKLTFIIICPSVIKILPIAFLDPKMDKWIRNLVQKNIESRQGIELPHEDLLQSLLRMKEKQDMTEDDIAGQALSMFLEGYETSSSAMAFVVYELAKHPDVQEKCFEEIKEVLELNNNELTFDSLSQLKYLDMCFNEVIRVDPISPVLLKVCTKSYTMPLVTGQKKPLTINPGIPILIPVRALQKDPEFFPNPESFDPNRFSEENQNSIVKGSYLPFGDGPRMCPGMRFALTQVKAGLVTLLRNFEIKLSPNCKPFVEEPKTMLLQAKDGLLVNFVARKNGI